MYSVNEHLLIEFRTPFRIANEKSITTIGARENCCIFPGFCWILLTAKVMNLLILSEVCNVVTNSNTEIVCLLLISLQTADYKMELSGNLIFLYASCSINVPNWIL